MKRQTNNVKVRSSLATYPIYKRHYYNHHHRHHERNDDDDANNNDNHDNNYPHYYSYTLFLNDIKLFHRNKY